jgi:hypothetical protein
MNEECTFEKVHTLFGREAKQGFLQELPFDKKARYT